MRTIRRDAPCRRRWLISIASAALLAGCGGPYAWNAYLDPGYVAGTNGIVSPSSVPLQVTGTVGGLSADELHTAVAQAVQAPSMVRASADATAQQGSSAPPDPATRTVWAFSSSPASGSAGTEVHVVATYYRDNAILSVAEGNSVITGADDPRLRQLVAYVTSALVPSVRHGGNGHS